MSKTPRLPTSLLSGLLLLVLLLSACGSASAPEPLARPEASEEHDIAFPRQQPNPAPAVAPDAAISGRLVLVDGCLRVNSEPGGPSWLPVWPADFLLTISSGALAVDDGSGSIVAQVGDLLRLRGGTIPDDPAAWQATVQLRQPPPSACPGPYWLVGKS
ncbi:MAG TPA: hypothetical protein VFS21_22575 [Roseiflexaceae bacterium]|nr:hypothetical protein [Roseiflexaceae bacterium]